MASPGNQRSANCIGTLSFPILLTRPDTDIFDPMTDNRTRWANFPTAKYSATIVLNYDYCGRV